MADRLISAGVAVCLAFLVWLYARSRDHEMLDNVSIPVQIRLAPSQAEHYDLEVTGPSQIGASFIGPPSRIRELRSMLRRAQMTVEVALAVPEDRLNETRYLDTVRVEAADLHPPAGVRSLVVEGRNRIPVTLRRLAERRLPVRLDQASDDRFSQVTLEPATVLVRGPLEILDRIPAIPTQPFVPPLRSDAAPLQESVASTLVPLVTELDGRAVRTTPGSVMVRLVMKPREKIYDLADVPVQFLCPPNFTLRPQWPPYAGDRAGKISVRVRGPATEESPALIAFIDLTGRKFEPGLYADEPLRLQLPRDFQLAQNPPRSATFQLVAVPVGREGEPALGGVRGP